VRRAKAAFLSGCKSHLAIFLQPEAIGAVMEERDHDELAKHLVGVQLVQVQPGQSRSGANRRGRVQIHILYG